MKTFPIPYLEYSINDVRSYINFKRYDVKDKSLKNLCMKLQEHENKYSYLFLTFSKDRLIQFIRKNDYQVNTKQEVDKIKGELVKLYKKNQKFISYPDGSVYGSPESINLSFPYKLRFTLPREIVQVFAAIQESDYRDNTFDVPYDIGEGIVTKYLNLPVVFVDPLEQYGSINDYFQEDCRLNCTDVNPMDYFQKNKYVIAKRVMRKHGKITDRTLSEQVYEMTTNCAPFKALYFKYFIDMFSAKRVLEISYDGDNHIVGFLASNASVYRGS